MGQCVVKVTAWRVRLHELTGELRSLELVARFLLPDQPFRPDAIGTHHLKSTLFSCDRQDDFDFCVTKRQPRRRFHPVSADGNRDDAVDLAVSRSWRVGKTGFERRNEGGRQRWAVQRSWQYDDK